MSRRILYLGDTSLSTAAAYLSGLLHAWRWPFAYVPSDRALDAAELDRALPERPGALAILSDYPAARLSSAAQERLVERVRRGMGLVMIGGWESYRGLHGHWQSTPVAEVLPVAMQDVDDRLNFDQPALVRRVADHEVLRDLPWETRPPCVGGLNRLAAKPAGLVVLEVQQFSAQMVDKEFRFVSAATHPLLVLGEHGAGRVAALATDVAPHWVGGLVDWGPSRVLARAPGGEAIEVGGGYARFLRQLLEWAAGGAPAGE